MKAFLLILASTVGLVSCRRVQTQFASSADATADIESLHATQAQAPDDALDTLLLALNPRVVNQHRAPAPVIDRRARLNVPYRPAAMSDVATEEQQESFQFEAEVSKVMDIIINSLYSDKDIFLRELVSNAADACDKKRFESVSAGSKYDGKIRIITDKETNTITIEDNGIGMTKQELKENLGRIAQSGTKKFGEALKEKAGNEASNLIGQFGVGFYSSFLVADKVKVITKSAGGAQLRWESESADKYTITEDESPPIEDSGTRIVLHIKEDMDKYLDTYTLRSMLKKYSEFLQFPIEIWAEKTEYEQVPDESAEVKEGEEPKMKTVPKTTNAWETVNSATPLWLKEPKDITEEEYAEFYKTAFGQYDEPLSKAHFSLEGQIEFRALLFLPSTVPWELSQDMFNENVNPVKLYVRRVFISDKFSEELLPRWLQFLKGIVDSDDLPLNVSREILQKSRTLLIMRRRLIKKALAMIKALQSDKEKWKTFNDNYARYVKVGLIEDKDNKDEILKIATFDSTHSTDLTTMADYVSRMKEGQKQIYYITGASRQTAMSSPALERLKKKGFEVIFGLNQFDEVALQGLGKYEDYDVVDAAKENVDMDETEEEKEEKQKTQEDMKPTCSFLQDAVGEFVDKVEVSNRLESSPSALVQPLYGMSPSMQKFMKQQSADPTGVVQKAILEINAKHPVIKKLSSMVAADGDKPSTTAKNYAKLVYEMAALSSGWEISDPASFANRIAALMEGGDAALEGLSGDSDETEDVGATESTSDETKGNEDGATESTETINSEDSAEEIIEPEVL